MLEDRFLEVYSKFKLFFYQETFARFQSREASLTTVEAFAMEAIYALGEPTVQEFATFMRVSSSNAAYKVAGLVRKGFVERVRSATDKRIYHLRPTQKYLDYYNVATEYVKTVTHRIERRFSDQDLSVFERILAVTDDELMPEVALPTARSHTPEAEAGKVPKA